MTKRDILENQVKSIYLGVGSNLGNKKSNIEKTKFELEKKNIKIIRTSSYYESLSWPNKKHPKFLNIILEVCTHFSPSQLIKNCQEIEIFLGRKNTQRNYPRKCDIDIIDYNKRIINDFIVLPHPRMHLRNFVLLPLFEINKDWIHPISKLHIKNLILSLPNRDITSIKQI